MLRRIMDYLSPISQPAKAILESFEEEGRWVVKQQYMIFPSTYWNLVDTNTGAGLVVARGHLDNMRLKMDDCFLSKREYHLVSKQCVNVVKKYIREQNNKEQEEKKSLVEKNKQKYMKLYVKPYNEQQRTQY